MGAARQLQDGTHLLPSLDDLVPPAKGPGLFRALRFGPVVPVVLLLQKAPEMSTGRSVLDRGTVCGLKAVMVTIRPFRVFFPLRRSLSQEPHFHGLSPHRPKPVGVLVPVLQTCRDSVGRLSRR